METLKKDVEKLKSVQTEFARARTKLDEESKERQGKVQKAAFYLEGFKARYNEAKEKNSFPVVVEDHKYTEQELVQQIKLTLAEKKANEQVVTQMDAALKNQEEKRNVLAMRITESQAKLSLLDSQKVMLQADKLSSAGAEILKNVNDVLVENANVKDESPIRTLDDIAKGTAQGGNAKTAVMDKEVEDFLKSGKSDGLASIRRAWHLPGWPKNWTSAPRVLPILPPRDHHASAGRGRAPARAASPCRRLLPHRDQGAPPEPARLRDISTLGLSCETRSRIPEMTTLKVDLELPGGKAGKQQPVAAEGVVVRCARLPAGKAEGYEVAIYFTRMDGRHKDAIGPQRGRQARALTRRRITRAAPPRAGGSPPGRGPSPCCPGPRSPRAAQRPARPCRHRLRAAGARPAAAAPRSRRRSRGTS